MSRTTESEHGRVAYPLHEKYRAFKEATSTGGEGDEQDVAVVVDGKKMVRTCAGALVLPEQAGHRPMAASVCLFCLTCQGTVGVTAEVYARAQAAADADGFVATPPGDLTPGSLPSEVRGWLYSDASRGALGKGQLAAAELFMDTTGLRDGAGLTALGLEMQALVQTPKVAASALSPTPGRAFLKRYGAAEAKRSPRPKATRPIATTAPMICTCGHGVAAHTSPDPTVLASACSTGCGCKRYAQVPAPKPVKAPKRSKPVVA